MASITWGNEFGSGLPQATISLDNVVYRGIDATNIKGGYPQYNGTEVVIVFDSESGANIAMPTVLQQLQSVGGIHGHLHDPRTGATVY